MSLFDRISSTIKKSTASVLTTVTRKILLITVAASLIVVFPEQADAQRDIVFPVIGNSSYVNDYDAPRSNGKHNAIDIIANKRQGVVSATDGVIERVWYPQPSWGYHITIRDSDGYKYEYLHLNNDTPGTDDGRGGGMHAYAPDMVRGNTVKKGQLIGWVGDSGNAEDTVPHLHFEIIRPNGHPMNPYQSLRSATRISAPRTYPQLGHEYLPYGLTTRIQANIAIGNFDSNPSTQETVVGAGAGGGPHVKVYNSNGDTISNFFAYNREFRGGVDVAAADIDGDGIDEIITGAGIGGGPHVRIFRRDGTPLHQFFAYNKENRSGIRVSAGDLDGDGNPEIVTVPQSKSGPHVRAFTRQGTIVSSFFAYNKENRSGLDVDTGDIDGNGVNEIITGAGIGSGPHVRVFSKQGAIVSSFFVYNKENRSGVRVSSDDVVASDGIDEIVVAPASRGGPDIKAFNKNGMQLQNNMILEEWWRGGYDVAAGSGVVKASAGELRRTTVRSGF